MFLNGPNKYLLPLFPVMESGSGKKSYDFQSKALKRALLNQIKVVLTLLCLSMFDPLSLVHLIKCDGRGGPRCDSAAFSLSGKIITVLNNR